VEDLEGVVAMPGAQALVRSIPAGRWTVATSATRPLAEVRLRTAGIPILGSLVTAPTSSTASRIPSLPEGRGAAGLSCFRMCRSGGRARGIRAGKAAGAR